jgi:hypothetical protein
MAVAFNKFYCFVEDLAEKIHNLGSDQCYVYLSNTAPSTANTAYDGTTGTTGPKEIAAANGYGAKGNKANVTSSAQTGGVYKLVLTSPAAFTAAGGTIGAFRYAVLFNDTAAAKQLIGWWDYGSSITLNDGETFTLTLDPTNGVLTIT